MYVYTVWMMVDSSTKYFAVVKFVVVLNWRIPKKKQLKLDYSKVSGRMAYLKGSLFFYNSYWAKSNNDKEIHSMLFKLYVQYFLK